MFRTAVSAKNMRNDYYFNRIYFKRIIQFFKLVNDARQNSFAKLTDTEISPLGLKFGCSIHDVKKEMGKAKYVYDNENSQNNLKVLFYRRTFTDISLLVQLQFLNNQLYFIGLDVIRRLINDGEKSEIINTVIQKYLNKPFMIGDAYPLIQDSNQNTIIINDDINFSICYLSGIVNGEKQKKVLKAMENVLQEKPDKGSLFYAF